MAFLEDHHLTYWPLEKCKKYLSKNFRLFLIHVAVPLCNHLNFDLSLFYYAIGYVKTLIFVEKLIRDYEGIKMSSTLIIFQVMRSIETYC